MAFGIHSNLMYSVDFWNLICWWNILSQDVFGSEIYSCTLENSA